ncbi:hypothetical protein LGQ02_06960 [Bacillus shivajii]|uniref:hypothetical protein n=1 Tax=Bacillus shivajii TaxID=1983719 RepID=UPI001CF96807|nr:hypothetical protein [Bacillus shivajii]UCZ54495.1 hypothetical protein LGQ02_06960 [Bacillus shivajii]
MQGLLDNPLILFFIIAAILSFFQGLGGDKKQEDKRPNRPQNRPQQSGHQQKEEEVDWREIFKQEQPSVEERHEKTRQPTVERESVSKHEPAKELEKANNDLSDRYEALKKRKEEALKQVKKVDKSPITEGDITKKTSKVELDFSKVSRDEAIKGIVWSEILGKPRSRRPRETFTNRK